MVLLGPAGEKWVWALQFLQGPHACLLCWLSGCSARGCGGGGAAGQDEVDGVFGEAVEGDVVGAGHLLQSGDGITSGGGVAGCPFDVEEVSVEDLGGRFDVQSLLDGAAGGVEVGALAVGVPAGEGVGGVGDPGQHVLDDGVGPGQGPAVERLAADQPVRPFQVRDAACGAGGQAAGGQLLEAVPVGGDGRVEGVPVPLLGRGSSGYPSLVSPI